LFKLVKSTTAVQSCSYFAVSLQISDLPDAASSSKLAYWQSEALSRDLSTQVGSQSQLNARQLISCPSLLAAALLSDPPVVMVPLQSPPKRSAVVDWLQQPDYGQPVESKNAAVNNTASKKDAGLVPAAGSLLPVNYGQSVGSKHICVNTRSTKVKLIHVAKLPTETSGSEKPSVHVGQEEKNDNESSNSNSTNIAGDGGDVKGNKKSLLQRRECRVSFLTDAGKTEINSAGLLEDDRSNSADEVVDNNYPDTVAASDDDDDDDLQKAEEQRASLSNSTSVLFCTQPSASGRSLPKASFIDLEVPDSWRSHRHSQVSDGFRHFGSIEIPHRCTIVPEAAVVSMHVASTPTTTSKDHRDGERGNLSSISCSPITPRTTSHKMLKTRSRERPDSPSVEAREEDDVDLTVIPCSPIIPSTSAKSDQQWPARSRTCDTGNGTNLNHHADKDGDDDGDDIVIIPCTPVTPTSSQTVVNSACGKELSTTAEGYEDGKPEDEEVTVVPCSPITPTPVPVKAVKNKLQADIRRISRLKVLLCFASHSISRLIAIVVRCSSFVLTILHSDDNFLE